VRDVADLHLRAMTDPAAKGERFLAISGDCVWMRDVALHLKQTLPPALAKKVPARQLPNWLVFLAALRMPEVKVLLPELGKEKHATGEKAKRLLGWNPIPWQDAATATAESLMKLDA
jgi:nucleoside-diphosphate-sugar epimerase